MKRTYHVFPLDGPAKLTEARQAYGARQDPDEIDAMLSSRTVGHRDETDSRLGFTVEVSVPDDWTDGTELFETWTKSQPLIAEALETETEKTADAAPETPADMFGLLVAKYAEAIAIALDSGSSEAVAVVLDDSARLTGRYLEVAAHYGDRDENPFEALLRQIQDLPETDERN